MVDQVAEVIVAQPAQRLHSAGLRACPIWIAPEWVVRAVGTTRLDAVEWVSRAADAGVGSLLLIAKQHDGRCIWPTHLPALGTDDDFFGAVIGAGVLEHVANVGESLDLLAQYGGLDPATKGKPEDWVVLDYLP